MSWVEREDANIAHIYTPDLISTIFYNNGILIQDPNRLPTDTKALIFGTGGDDWSIDPTDYLLKRRIAKHQRLFAELEKRNIPVYLAEPGYDPKKRLFGYLADAFIKPVVAIPTIMLTGKAEEKINHRLDEIPTEDKLTRRRLLKKGLIFAAKSGVFSIRTGIVGWSLMPTAQFVGKPTSELMNSFKNEATELVKENYRLHPWHYLLNLKKAAHAVVATKLHWLAERIGGRPRIVTTLSWDDMAIENQIQASPQERINSLKQTEGMLNLASLSLEDIFQQSTIHRLTKFVPTGSVPWRLDDSYSIGELRRFTSAIEWRLILPWFRN